MNTKLDLLRSTALAALVAAAGAAFSLPALAQETTPEDPDAPVVEAQDTEPVDPDAPVAEETGASEDPGVDTNAVTLAVDGLPAVDADGFTPAEVSQLVAAFEADPDSFVEGVAADGSAIDEGTVSARLAAVLTADPSKMDTVAAIASTTGTARARSIIGTATVRSAEAVLTADPSRVSAVIDVAAASGNARIEADIGAASSRAAATLEARGGAGDAANASNIISQVATTGSPGLQTAFTETSTQLAAAAGAPPPAAPPADAPPAPAAAPPAPAAAPPAPPAGAAPPATASSTPTSPPGGGGGTTTPTGVSGGGGGGAPTTVAGGGGAGTPFSP